MKVLCIEAAYGFGGSLTGLLELIRYMPADVEPILATAFDPWDRVGRPDNLRHVRVDYRPPPPVEDDTHWLPGTWRYYRTLMRPWARATSKLIREYRPDVVYAGNCLSLNYGVGRAARAAGIPTVLHQKDFEYPGRLTRLMARRSPFDHHIAMSRSIGDQMRQLGIAPESITEIFDPMTPPDESLVDRRRQRSLATDHPVVAMHSMIIRWKGQHVFVRAVAELARRGVTNFRPVIAGSPPAGEPEYLDEIRSLAAELNVLDRFEFPGHQKDINEFLSGVDIGVHCSIEPEPFGRVVPEVMLMGISGVVGDAGGPAQYVTDGVTGLHAAGDDPVALADALQRLLAMPAADRQAMGDAARREALRAFEPETLSADMVDVLRGVAAGRRVPVGV